jgi:uncharacterized RDD family membrane protein YckC
VIGAAYAGSRVLRTEVAYAGFWRRFAAYWIDFAVLLGLQLVIASGVFNIAPVSSVIGWAYFALLESSPARGTLGKVALHLVVGDVHGDPITFRRASARYWLKVLSTLVFGVGWLLAAFTPRKQALHDMLAGCLVLRRVTYFVLGPEAPTEPGEYWDGTRWVASVRMEEA